MQFVRKMGVYDIVPTATCYAMSGKPPIRSRWVDINKGDETNINYRIIWVAQETRNDKGQWEMFAGTPPLEAIRYLLSV